MGAFEIDYAPPDWYTRTGGEHFLATTSLPQAAKWLISAGRISRSRRGTPLSYGREWVHIIDDGCVMETRPHGTQRIWTAGAIIGDVASLIRPHEQPRRPLAGARVTLLSDSTVISVTARTLSRAVTEEPHVALLLLQLVSGRAETLESVYASAHLPARAQIAKLLIYLADGGEERRWKYTRRNLKIIPAGIYLVDGPSQADIATALGLGRATVEKALGSLREEGILKRQERGERTNCLYEIEDMAALRRIAAGSPS
ncbi:Crp/Fnr family transcriptional regulator [Streptomyces sp. B27]|uniref:Crp/Fnr family transcriptional regulator n=1 Tax=Streptomyces sp. B27 TaxID=2485015 RepID=UPI000FDC4210|nr:Crp/Fnr family transcriptional regulator [Streptomyces sp. B27]